MLLTLSLGTAIPVTSIGAQAIPETHVKAEMIRRFPDFVEWPAASLGQRDDIAVCFSASHPFGSLVNGLAKGPRVKGHGIQVRELKKTDRPDGCHVLYVAQADEALLERARQLPLLTIGDQGDFCHVGGIINLRVVEGRVRFEVHVGQARKVGLRLDSQFVRLATAVFGGRP